MDNRSFLTQLLMKVTEPNQESASMTLQAAPKPDDEIIDLGNSFNFDGFQVVRREFFAHLREPSATLSDYKFSVNSACLKRFPDTTSVQVLINKEKKMMALMPCPDGAKDSFAWCKDTKGKITPKIVSCKLFFAKVADMMDWNPHYRYKLLGRLIQANGQMLLAFDLKAAEIYQRTFAEGEKPKTSRTPIFPAEWQNQFGLPYSEHRHSMEVDIFDGYAIYSVKDTSDAAAADTKEDPLSDPPQNEPPVPTE